MKRIIVIAVLAMGFCVMGCSSENKQEKMWDTSVNADTGIIDIDTNTTGTGTTGSGAMGTGRRTDTSRADTVNRDNTIKADSIRQ